MLILCIGAILVIVLLNLFEVSFLEKAGTVILLLLLIGFFLIIFCRKGLVHRNNKFGLAYFIGNTVLFKKTIKLEGKTRISILKFRKSQNLTSFGIIYPSSSHSFNSFDVYALNESHTIKELVLTLKSPIMAERASRFLIGNSELKLETYSPDFGKTSGQQRV